MKMLGIQSYYFKEGSKLPFYISNTECLFFLFLCISATKNLNSTLGKKRVEEKEEPL